MREYSFNAAWLVLEKAVRFLVTVFVTFYIARYLGPSDLGKLSYALAWLGILGSLSSLGLDSIALREISRFPDKSNSILSTGVILKLFASLFFIFLVCVIYLFSNEDIEARFVLIISLSLLFQPLNLCEVYFQANADSGKVTQLQIKQSIISSLLKLLIIYFDGSLEFLLWSYVFDAFFLGIGVYQIYQKRVGLKISFLKFNFFMARDLLLTAFPIFLSGLSVAVYMKVDVIMLEAMVPSFQLGIYSAAAKLSESWYFVPVALYSAFSPLLFKLKVEHHQRFKERLKQLYSLLIWGSTIIAVLTSIFSSSIVMLVYGDKFIQAGEVLSVHIWSGIFICIGLVNSISLLSQNKLYQSLTRNIVGALINIFLNFLLIPLWGPIGAAYATLAAYAFSGWVSSLFFKNGAEEFLMPIKSLATIPKLFS